MEKIGAFILGVILLLEIVYIGLIPFNINKIADELEGIKKVLNEISNRGK